MSFKEKWFERLVVAGLITVGWVSQIYILSVIGVIWLIQAI